MPELPEVSYFKKYLDSTSLHKEITKVECDAKKILQASEKMFQEHLVGKELSGSRRIGKYLVVETTGDQCLVYHFGMTGKFEYSHQEESPDYAHFILHFQDHSRLFFICPRKFAKVFLSDSYESFVQDRDLGTDALELSQKQFLELAEGKKGSIKSLLMNQKLIAGIGNLYSDEVCFQSKIHPDSKVSNLSNQDLKLLFKNIAKVLNRVTESKMEGSKLPDSFIMRHRKEGGKCPRDQGEINMDKIGGRSSYFCNSCQQKK